MSMAGGKKRNTPRKRPLVWIKELVLFESLDPLVQIRRLPFDMGLNIIQGEANDSSDAFETGHGIGKTTVCRLIRYCLGEKTFGQQHVVAEVRHCFPSSFVGAVIEVAGVEWSVMRGLGQRARHYAKEGVPLAELVTSDDPMDFERFTEALDAAAFEGMADRSILSNGESLEWLHLLAMCSRDQEARYDLYWNWRHKRSDSLSPRFAKGKVDAGLCLRAVLGLLESKEPRLRKKLEELEQSLAQIRDQIKEKEYEPTVNVNRLRKKLVEVYGVEDADIAPAEGDQLFGVGQAAERRLKALRKDVSDINEQLAPLDRQINLASASLLELTEMSGQYSAASEVTNEGNDVLLSQVVNLRRQRESLSDLSSAMCQPARILFGDCEHVQSRIAGLDDEVSRQKETMPEVVEREQEAAALTDQAERLQTPIDRLRSRINELNRQKNDLLEKRFGLNRQIEAIPKVIVELQQWSGVLQGTVPNTDLNSLKSSESDTEREIESTKAELDKVVSRQRERAKSFVSGFNGLVQKTINKEFKGEIDVDEEGVTFRISRENSLAGEAYETLAVLLADIALLLESPATTAHHPGFLLHDSPREADLNVRIYERLLETASSSMQEARDGDDIPFQYIVTTTTPPSDKLRSDSVTMHTLSGGEGSLFGRQLEVAAAAQGKLFDEGDEQ